ncbi:recombinase family protein [Salmonella enterica]|uniref:Recombinase family protein n=1 Tax=Klebsiella pneumoniae TaxID=573 RepID=A0A483M3G8_KLEPN|nr:MULTISPECIES: recombinase family protein [Enterobacteriaceae]EAA7508118.1 recombinase family protein [Salmonella enterica]EAY2652183.1 recombinase family protein [Salmonella enterica subsp. enterica serovar Dublin]EBO1456212.1 recombinase family protein [Salmonella enterica subsp. enterica serovar Newport]EBP6904039.1 recombinase family protein [Salmonella enterica subsp. enterica]ECV5498557.1 recombinase family protein [Salmonella enterica subsp. enterica serovar Enteritidis]EDG9669672.1 
MKIGYARKSTKEQDTSLEYQIEALQKAGCEKWYAEQVSRGGNKRLKTGTPELENCLKALRAGDTLVVWALDRLGGTLLQLLQLMNELRSKGIHFESLKERIDTQSPMGEMYYSLIAIFSNFEVARNHERTMAGLAAAKKKGRIGGRKPKLSPQDIKEINALVKSPEITVKEIAARFKVSRPTIYRHITPDSNNTD